MKRTVYPAVLVLMGVACGAQAQAMKPGLWEISQKMQSASGEMEKAMADMQKELAAMPPEQRKMMQDMMAKQGVAMGGGGPGATSVKVCMTREMVERNEVGAAQGDCKSSYAPRTGNTMKMSFVCTKPPSSGEGQVSFRGPEEYTSRMTVNTMHNGKNEKMTMDGHGKWIATECGAVKPMVTPKK
jgi:Protein of unknown function (DUF3617)